MEISSKLLNTINSLPRPTVVAVSGFGGSGKTTFAKMLGDKLDAPVVGVDAFQKPGSFDSQYSLWEIMDFDRLEHQVLRPFLSKDSVISYENFDPKIESISEIIKFKNNGIVIVEGVGLFRPELSSYLTYKIWIDLPIKEAIARGKKRDREEYHNPTDELWDGIWKENDLDYYETFKPAEIADFILKN
jgi:uridine kinase